MQSGSILICPLFWFNSNTCKTNDIPTICTSICCLPCVLFSNANWYGKHGDHYLLNTMVLWTCLNADNSIQLKAAGLWALQCLQRDKPPLGLSVTEEGGNCINSHKVCQNEDAEICWRPTNKLNICYGVNRENDVLVNEFKEATDSSRVMLVTVWAFLRERAVHQGKDIKCIEQFKQFLCNRKQWRAFLLHF